MTKWKPMTLLRSARVMPSSGEGGRWKPLVFVGADDDGIDIRYGDSVTHICYGGGHHCDTDGHDYCRFELYVSVD